MWSSLDHEDACGVSAVLYAAIPRFFSSFLGVARGPQGENWPVYWGPHARRLLVSHVIPVCLDRCSGGAGRRASEIRCIPCSDPVVSAASRVAPRLSRSQRVDRAAGAANRGLRPRCRCRGFWGGAWGALGGGRRRAAEQVHPALHTCSFQEKLLFRPFPACGAAHSNVHFYVAGQVTRLR